MRRRHERELVSTGVLCDVSQEITARHPVRNESEGSNDYTKKGDNFWMCQGFDITTGYLMKGLKGFK